MEEMQFSKKQVLKSKKYAEFQDIFNVILTDGQNYTEEELEKLKDDFLSAPVNEKVNA